MNYHSRLIGLTGGIGTGKTTVSNYLAQTYNLPILDADVYAKEAVADNSPVLKKIVTRYGTKIITANGQLNRAALGEIIFNNQEEKKWLEQQIHPFVYNCFTKNIKALNEPIIVLVIPLLFEAEMTDLVTEIWVVSCDYQQQIERLKSRNNLTTKQAITRIKNQLPLAEKIAQADAILDNNGDKKYLFNQIDKLLIDNY